MIVFAWVLWSVWMAFIICYLSILVYAKIKRIRFQISYADLIMAILTFIFLTLYLFAK